MKGVEKNIQQSPFYEIMSPKGVIRNRIYAKYLNHKMFPKSNQVTKLYHCFWVCIVRSKVNSGNKN